MMFSNPTEIRSIDKEQATNGAKPEQAELRKQAQQLFALYSSDGQPSSK
jgi:hypothetical protein